MSEADFKWPEQNDAPKVKKDEQWTSAPERQVNSLAVLSNKMPWEVAPFYDYCKQNPEAQRIVDAVIKAFSIPPLTIDKFVENCDDFPLPTDLSSFEKFSTKYDQEIKTHTEAPKKETGIVETKQNNGEKEQADGKISKERETILKVLTPWNGHPGHPELLARYGDIFLNPQNHPADSAEFRQAINGLLKELVLDAQKTGDGTDARKILVAANEMGAIATVDFARWERELATLDAAKNSDKSNNWHTKPDLPVGFHPITTKAGEGEKFVNFALGSGKGKCDEVVSFPKDGGGKGNKTLVSAHSGYAVELVGVVDGVKVII